MIDKHSLDTLNSPFSGFYIGNIDKQINKTKHTKIEIKKLMIKDDKLKK